MTLTNLVFWLRLGILVGYLLEQKGRKSVCKFFLWPVPSHLTSDLTLKDDLDKSGFLAVASHFGRLYFGTKDRKSVGNFFFWPVPRHLTSDLTLKDDLDKSGFPAVASHFGRLYFVTKRSQTGW